MSASLRTRITRVLLLAALLLSACGQKGPLYLPDEEPEKKDKQSQIERADRQA